MGEQENMEKMDNTRAKTVLLLGDITGRSRVGVRMLTAVLEERGHEVLALPTAMISNTLNLGRHAALDTTDYLEKSLETWRALGIAYDFLYIGYITGLAQAELLAAEADRARGCGVPVLLDPILGDSGQAYASVSGEQAEGFRLLMGHASLITPNLTEACLLTDVPYDDAVLGGRTDELLERLCAPGCAAVITSARAADGGCAVLVQDGAGNRFCQPYERLSGRCGGAGDLFGAALIDALLQGCALEQAAARAGADTAREIALGERGLLPKI